jgi:2-dehydro-3-deoxygalactonokinase
MPASVTAPCCIVLDWGTTMFRALLVDASARVIDRVESSDGIQFVRNRGFEPILQRSIAAWRTAHGVLPVYAAGMIGSRNGWVEIPYVDAPAGAEAIAKAVKAVKLGDGAVVVFIPGLTDKSAYPFPDVMRGEETQLVGFGLDRDMTVVLPGTHSKWVRLEGGAITRFRTYVAGEVFATLSRHSFLAGVAQPPERPDWQAFLRGLDTALDRESGLGLLSRLFCVRTGWLAGSLRPTEMIDYLSGVVIGAEFHEAQSFGWFRPGEEIGIVGGTDLAERYRRAAETFALKPVLDPGDAMARGCRAIADIARRLAHGS